MQDCQGACSQAWLPGNCFAIVVPLYLGQVDGGLRYKCVTIRILTRMTTLARMRHHWRHFPHVSTSDVRFFIVDVDVGHSIFGTGTWIGKTDSILETTRDLSRNLNDSPQV